MNTIIPEKLKDHKKAIFKGVLLPDFINHS